MREVNNILGLVIPAMAADGGGLELISVDRGTVFIKLIGTCCFCPSADLTLKIGVEKTLKQHLSWVDKVVNLGTSKLTPSLMKEASRT